jgi:hypothetical protein
MILRARNLNEQIACPRDRVVSPDSEFLDVREGQNLLQMGFVELGMVEVQVAGMNVCLQHSILEQASFQLLSL